jgi:hypothetical protein
VTSSRAGRRLTIQMQLRQRPPVPFAQQGEGPRLSHALGAGGQSEQVGNTRLVALIRDALLPFDEETMGLPTPFE